MPKLKTHKAASKRVKVRKSGALEQRTAGQGHFNSRETGNVRRNKRSDKEAPQTLKKNLTSLMPYH